LRKVILHQAEKQSLILMPIQNRKQSHKMSQNWYEKTREESLYTIVYFLKHFLYGKGIT